MTRRHDVQKHDDLAGAIKTVLATSGALGDKDAEALDLVNTPSRVAKAYRELLRGYATTDVDFAKEVTTFPAMDTNELVATSGISFTSLCAHHLLPFHGTATIGYLPGKRLVGLSKLARVLDHFAARLQVQERLGAQVASFLHSQCGAVYAVCILKAEHQCMTCRGVRKPGALTHTASVRPHDVSRDLLTEFYQLVGL